MITNISEKLYNTNTLLIDMPATDLSVTLNQTLNNLLSLPLAASSGLMIDSTNQKTDVFGSLIYTQSVETTEDDPNEISADKIACVIDIADTMTLENLRLAHLKITQAKKIKAACMSNTRMSPKPQGALGIIFAKKSDVALESLGEELARLNKDIPSTAWPDMLIILSQGTISYGMQHYGSPDVGDMILPDETASPYPPAIYVISLVKATKDYALNNMFSYIFAYLQIIRPALNLPSYLDIIKNTSHKAMPLAGYQYNLRGELCTIPRHGYKGQALPKPIFYIEDKKNNPIAILDFSPWQDGSIIALKGNLSLNTILSLLDKTKQYPIIHVPNSNIQTSPVLPINYLHFQCLLQQINAQKDFSVKQHKQTFTKSTFSDEGASSPFSARIFIGMLDLRDNALKNPALYKEFDKTYHLIITELYKLKATAKKINDLWEDHSSKLSQGKAGIIEPDGSIRIINNIDRELRNEVESFTITAVRILKNSMQNLIRLFNVDIGFLFKKPSAFQTSLQRLYASNPSLAAYLEKCRNLWSEQLINSRNSLEHHDTRLADVSHFNDSGTLRASEPIIENQPVTQFIKFILDRLTCFVEDITAHCLQTQLEPGFIFTEIKLQERNPEIPKRFRLSVEQEAVEAWSICYKSILFEDS